MHLKSQNEADIIPELPSKAKVSAFIQLIDFFDLIIFKINFQIDKSADPIDDAFETEMQNFKDLLNKIREIMDGICSKNQYINR